MSSFKIYFHTFIWDPFNQIAIQQFFISRNGKFSGQRHWCYFEFLFA